MGRKPGSANKYPKYYRHKLADDMLWEVQYEGAQPMVIAAEFAPIPRPSSRSTEAELLESSCIYQTTREGIAIGG